VDPAGQRGAAAQDLAVTAGGSGRPGIRPDIQGLRALAVSLVVLDHLLLRGFGGGYLGVDVFFVVSGFLITGLLLREFQRQRTISILGFYARRARRILPAATLVLVATSLYAAWSLPVSRVEEVLSDVRWSALFAANWHFAELGTDYFSQDRAASPVQHFWSLAVEEQFYLVWPGLLAVVMVLGGRHRRRVLAALLGLTWCASLAGAVVLVNSSPTAAYFSSLTRAWELATGALLAVVATRLTRLRSWSRLVLGAGGLAAILAAAATFTDTTDVPGLPTLVPVFGTAALLAAGSGGDVPGIGRLLAVRPVQWVGDASYSIYLWHWPVLLLGGERLDLGPVPEAFVLVALTLVLSALSLYLVESPFRTGRLAVARGPRALVLWPATLALVVGSVAIASAHADTAQRSREAAAREWFEQHRPQLPTPTGSTSTGPATAAPTAPAPAVPVSRLLEQAVRAADAGAPIPPDLPNLRGLKKDVWMTWFTCYLDFDTSRGSICPLGDPAAATTVVAYGDSHLGMWLPALDDLGRRLHFRVVPLIKLGCGPFDAEQWHDGAPMPSCPEFRRWALGEIRRAGPDLVLVGYRGLWAVRPGDGETKAEAWQHGAERTLHELTALAPRVVVLGDIPSVRTGPADCLQAAGASLAGCTVGEDDVALEANALVEGAARRTRADYVDLTSLVCWQHRCPITTLELVVYRDDSHVSLSWARRAANDLGQLAGLG